mmetsp:Transcript_20038/g.52811  ORF Transcript_20038/g.52811 Transcript_20038/m.52811 type:complete len:404 (-) Transcript_20038:287-1498(-)
MSVLAREHHVPRRRVLAKSEMVDDVRHVGEGQVQCLVLGVRGLEVHGAGHAGDLHMASDPAALGEDLVVVRACVHVALADLPGRELHERARLPLAVVVRELVLAGAAAVQPDLREGLDLLFLARLLEVDAVDLQHPDVGLHAVRVLDFVLAAVYLLLELVPGGHEVAAMRAPIRIEVDEGEVVGFDDLIEVAMLERVAGGAPIGVQLLELVLRQVLAGILEFHDLVLRIRMALILPLVVDALLLHVPRDVHALRAERIPDADRDVIASHVQHGHIEVDFQHGVLVAVQQHVRPVLRRQESRQLADKQHGAGDHGGEGHHGARGRGLGQIRGHRAEGIQVLDPPRRRHAAGDHGGGGGGGGGGYGGGGARQPSLQQQQQQSAAGQAPRPEGFQAFQGQGQRLGG